LSSESKIGSTLLDISFVSFLQCSFVQGLPPYFLNVVNEREYKDKPNESLVPFDTNLDSLHYLSVISYSQRFVHFRLINCRPDTKFHQLTFSDDIMKALDFYQVPDETVNLARLYKAYGKEGDLKKTKELFVGLSSKTLFKNRIIRQTLADQFTRQSWDGEAASVLRRTNLYDAYRKTETSVTDQIQAEISVAASVFSVEHPTVGDIVTTVEQVKVS
jgi:hypothetical protein